jgi:hypothetical protein
MSFPAAAVCLLETVGLWPARACESRAAIFFGGTRGGGKMDGVLGKWALKERRYGSAFNAIIITRLAKAAAWSSCLWGGQFNPVIPINDPALADQLVKTFALDVLIPIDVTEKARTFINRFPHLTHERWREPIFSGRAEREITTDLAKEAWYGPSVAWHDPH